MSSIVSKQGKTSIIKSGFFYISIILLDLELSKAHFCGNFADMAMAFLNAGPESGG